MPFNKSRFDKELQFIKDLEIYELGILEVPSSELQYIDNQKTFFELSFQTISKAIGFTASNTFQIIRKIYQILTKNCKLDAVFAIRFRLDLQKLQS